MYDAQKLPRNVVSVIFDGCQNTGWVPEPLRFGWCVGDDPIAKRISVTPFYRPEGTVVTQIYPKLEGNKAKRGTRNR